jgi:hypothetical protein
MARTGSVFTVLDARSFRDVFSVKMGTLFNQVRSLPSRCWCLGPVPSRRRCCTDCVAKAADAHRAATLPVVVQCVQGLR